MRRLLLPLSLAALVLPAAGAPAKGAASHCPSAALTVAVRGSGTVCAAYPAPRSAPGRAGLSARDLLDRVPRGVRPRVAASRLRRLDRLTRLALTPRSTATARAAQEHAGSAGDCRELQPGPRTAVPGDALGEDAAGARVEAAGVSRAPEDGSATSVGDADVVVRTGQDERATRHRSCWSWDPCPDVTGTVRGRHEFLDEERVTVADARRRTTSRVRWSYETDLVAHVGDDARVATYDLKTFVSVENGHEVRDATGRLVEHQPTKRIIATLTATGVDPHHPGPLSAVSATARGPKGDNLTRDEVTGITEFVAVVLQDVRAEAIGGLLEAETAWYDRFLCVKVAANPAVARLHDDETVPVAFTARAKDGSEVRGTYEAAAMQGTVTPEQGTVPATLRYLPPHPLPQGDLTTVHMLVTSRQGRGEGFAHGTSPTPTPPPGPMRFRILDAALKLDVTGAKTAAADQPCAAAGLPVGSHEVLDAASTQPESSEVVLAASGSGRLSGEFSTTVPTKRSFDLRGCQGRDHGNPMTLCTTSFERPVVGGTALGMSLSADSADARTATLTWWIPPPSFGFIDADDSVCNVSEVFQGLDYAQKSQTVELATLKGTRPFTLGFDGQADWSTDQRGAPATLHASWRYLLTLQRVG